MNAARLQFLLYLFPRNKFALCFLLQILFVSSNIAGRCHLKRHILRFYNALLQELLSHDTEKAAPLNKSVVDRSG